MSPAIFKYRKISKGLPPFFNIYNKWHDVEPKTFALLWNWWFQKLKVKSKLMVLHETVLTPSLRQWIFHSLVISHWNMKLSIEFLYRYQCYQKLPWFIRHLSEGLYNSIQNCEITHQTFGPIQRKCPTCPMIFVNTAVCVLLCVILLDDDKFYCFVEWRSVVLVLTRVFWFVFWISEWVLFVWWLRW